MDACNNFGPLFKSRLDRVLKQSTNFKAFIYAHHIVKPVLQVGPTSGPSYSKLVLFNPKLDSSNF
uniref:Uncharacterized protein n=1 Tax=Meloidogyne incognita TaxID=6306 RepID=A0A914NCA3_MELIC